MSHATLARAANRSLNEATAAVPALRRVSQAARTQLQAVCIGMCGGAAVIAFILSITFSWNAQKVAGEAGPPPSEAREDARQNALGQLKEEAGPDPSFDDVLNIRAPFLSPEVQRLMEMKVLQPMPVHDATGTTGSNVLSQRAFGSYKITGANGVQQTRYSPMLRVSTRF